MATAAEEANINGDDPVRCDFLSVFFQKHLLIFPTNTFLPNVHKRTYLLKVSDL